MYHFRCTLMTPARRAATIAGLLGVLAGAHCGDGAGTPAVTDARAGDVESTDAAANPDGPVDTGGQADGGVDDGGASDADWGDACVPRDCIGLFPDCGAAVDDGCGRMIRCDCPPGAWKGCSSDPSTRVTVGYQKIATPIGDCFSVPDKCVPGADAWRLVRVVTMENDYIRVTLADAAGDKVFDFNRKIDFVRDQSDWSGAPVPPTTGDHPDYPPDSAGREWLVRGGASAGSGCETKPGKADKDCSVEDVVTALLAGESPCRPSCDWSNLWGDADLGGSGIERAERMRGLQKLVKDAGFEWPLGLARDTPHWVHNIVGTGTQYSTALRDKAESKDNCLFMQNWNPNSNGTCDGTPNGGCHRTAAPECPFDEAACPSEPMGDNCGVDLDTCTGAPVVTLDAEPLRSEDPLDCHSRNLAGTRPPVPAPDIAEIGAHRVYFRSGMWRSFGGAVSYENGIVPKDTEPVECNGKQCGDEGPCGCCFPDRKADCPPPGEPDTSEGWAIFCCPSFPGFLGKQYWNNMFGWRAFDGGLLRRDCDTGDSCGSCSAPDGGPPTCECCQGGFSPGDDEFGASFDRDPDALGKVKKTCDGGESICNGWPTEPGFERPYPDQGYDRDDIWSETVVCLQGPEVILQQRIHHTADPGRHETHGKPGHAIPQAHQRGLFSHVVVGDRGRARSEPLPPPAFADTKRLGDRASDGYIGLVDRSAPYGVFLYEDFDLGVAPDGSSLGRIDEFSARPSEDVGNKARMATYSYRFPEVESTLDREFRYIFATREYVEAHARCYNQGLPFPCGIEERQLMDDDGIPLKTWVRSETGGGRRTFEVWSTTGAPDGELCGGDAEPRDGCWRVDDVVDRLLPLRGVRAPGTVDIYECVREKGPAENERHRYLAACPPGDPACGKSGPDAPCRVGNVKTGPIGRLLAVPAVEARTIWNLGFSVNEKGEPKSDGRAAGFNAGFTPEWRCDAADVEAAVPGCHGVGDRYGYVADRDGLVLGYAAPGPVLGRWVLDGGVGYSATAAPEPGGTHQEELGILLASAPRHVVNPGFVETSPRPPERPRVVPLYLCAAGPPSTATALSTNADCADIEGLEPAGRLGFLYADPFAHGPSAGMYAGPTATRMLRRCAHPTLGWNVVAGGDPDCASLGEQWSAGADLGHVLRFPDDIEPGESWEPR